MEREDPEVGPSSAPSGKLLGHDLPPLKKRKSDPTAAHGLAMATIIFLLGLAVTLVSGHPSDSGGGMSHEALSAHLGAQR